MQRVFQPPTAQWGLRGDSFFWQELTQDLVELLPLTSPDAIDSLLLALHERLVGESPITGRYPFVARYQRGDMSSGRVDGSFG